MTPMPYCHTFQFQSTLPVWGATRDSSLPDTAIIGFNPRSPCGERLLGILPASNEKEVSIHAPRVGSDWQNDIRQEAGRVSIHAPRVGSDSVKTRVEMVHRLFQSTLPVWGATDGTMCGRCTGRRFNPRSPCGERQRDCGWQYRPVQVSIHAPRVGSDGTQSNVLHSVALRTRIRGPGGEDPSRSVVLLHSSSTLHKHCT